MIVKEVFPPKYSIVIPTRNREKYLRYAVESVLSSGRSDIELVVSNNYSSDSTEKYLSALDDPRLKIVCPSDELPMSLHYEFALGQAVGEWVTILGDDDAVMPYLFDRLDTLIDRYPKVSIISSERAYYFWEGCEDLYGDTVVAYWRDPGCSLRSTKKDFLLALAGMRSCFNLPQIYTSCIVKQDLIKWIKAKSGGSFYQSIIPDIYSAVALSLAEKVYLRVEEPLFWTGTSSGSMGRTDRIYIDSAIGGKVEGRLKLHPDVPQKLHILGIESLYLYEALLNCPISSGFFNSNFIGKIVYANVLKVVKQEFARRGFDKNLVEKTVCEQIRRNQFSLHQIRMISAAIDVLTIIQNIFSTQKLIFRKFGRMLRRDTLVSKDRARFDTILKASREVRSMVRDFREPF